MRRLIRNFLPTPLGIRLFPVHGKLRGGFGRPLVRIAHLTDLHFCKNLLPRHPSGPGLLIQAVAALNAQPLDAVVITGDLFDLPEQIEEDGPEFAKIMRGLRHPWYVALGNHDVEGRQVSRRRKRIGEILGDHGLGKSTESWYQVPLGPGLRLIVLDSTDNGEVDYLTWRGHFSERQGKWLDDVLGTLRGEMVVIALHHPPVAPYPLMNALKFQVPDRRRLKRILARHENVSMMLCGHFHMSGCLPFGNVGVMAGPALVEHPHFYRIFELYPDRGLVTFHIEAVSLTRQEEASCSRIPARLRSRILGNLSHARAGVLRLPATSGLRHLVDTGNSGNSG